MSSIRWNNYKILDTVLLLMLFKLCGLATCSFSNFDFLRTGKVPTFVPSRITKLYNIVLIIFVILILIYLFVGMQTINVFTINKVTTVTMYGELTTSFLAAIAVLLLYTVKQKSFVEIITRLNKTELGLTTLTKIQTVPDRYNCPLVFFHLSVYTIAIIISLQLFPIGIFGIANQVSYLMLHLFIYQYEFFVRNIQLKFRTINLTLQDFFIEKTLDLGFDQYRINIGKEMMLYLRQTHLTLCEIAKDVAEFYASSFICCAVSTLYGTTIGFFNLYKTIISPDIKALLFLNNILYIWINFFPIWLLSMAVTNCSLEVSDFIKNIFANNFSMINYL